MIAEHAEPLWKTLGPFLFVASTLSTLRRGSERAWVIPTPCVMWMLTRAYHVLRNSSGLDAAARLVSVAREARSRYFGSWHSGSARSM